MKKRRSPKGFSLIELLIAMGLLAIILWALGSLLSSTNKSYATQKELINVQENARSTLRLIGRLLSNGVSSSVVISGTSPNNTLSFSMVEYFNRATGDSDKTHLKDETQNWTDNQWLTYSISIHSGSGSGPAINPIISNDNHQITISNTSPWPANPDATSDYKILSPHSFSLSGNSLQYTKNGTTTTLCDNISGFTATKVVTNSNTRIDLTLTAQTANNLLETGQIRSVALNSSVPLPN